MTDGAKCCVAASQSKSFREPNKKAGCCMKKIDIRKLNIKDIKTKGKVGLKAIREEKELRQELFAYCMLVLCPIITFYLFEGYTHNPFTTMKFKTQLLNILFYEMFGIMLYGLFRRLRQALLCQTLLFMGIGLANYYVLNFRSKPIMPWDLFSISTAASVAGNFSYSLDLTAIGVLIGFIVLIVLETRIKYKPKRRPRVRLMMVGLPFVLLYLYAGMIQNENFVSDFGLYDKLFTPTVMNKRNGNVVAFVMELAYLDVDKPEGYDKNAMIREYADLETEEYKNAIADPESVKRPNVIVIMDEAFSDLAVLGNFETNQDYMPFLHSIQQSDEAVTGYMNVSVLGGNTANTEFEFLTGHTLGFLPEGSVAYQQYLDSKEPSLASYLKKLGYSTIAMHPYYPDGWDRSRVYPLLGFDEFLSKDDLQTGAKKIRKYISDETCFEKIISLYENKGEDPLFVFNVTMQNHSGYDEEFDNFTSDVEVTGGTSKALNQYLSLLKQTDSALEKLIDYFRQAKEDTIIVFFGDHQPTTYVSNPILRLNGVDTNTLTDEEYLLKYKVPYMIWSNFGLENAQDKDTSANYLAVDVLNYCSLPLSPYRSFQENFRETYPIITANQVQTQDGTVYTTSQMKTESEIKEGLLPYQNLQYYLLFDYDPDAYGAVEEPENGQKIAAAYKAGDAF